MAFEIILLFFTCKDMQNMHTQQIFVHKLNLSGTIFCFLVYSWSKNSTSYPHHVASFADGYWIIVAHTPRFYCHGSGKFRKFLVT